MLGSVEHGVFYIQEYIDKPGRDLRTIVAGDEVICAVYRISPHWITNTHRSAATETCPLRSDIAELSRRAVRAVGGELLAVDLLESRDGRLLVCELNHGLEFHGAQEAAGIDIGGALVDYVLAQALSL